MSRSRRNILMLASTALIVSGCGGESGAGVSNSGDSDAIVIGMVEDTAGGAAGYSELGTQGIELRVKEINDAGGVLGRKIKLTRASDNNEPTQTPAVVRKLVEDGAVAVLLNSGSASAVQVKPVCKELKRVCLAVPNIDARIATAPDAEYSFSLANPITDIGELFANAFDAAGITKVAAISDDSPTMAGLNGLLLPAFKKRGVDLVADEKVAADAADVNAQVARLKSSKPDAVYVGSLGGQIEASIHNAVSQQMPGVQRFSLASIGNQPGTWKLADPGSLEGVIFASQASPDNPRTVTLEKLLKSDLGGDFDALTAYHQQGYDAVSLVAKAIEADGSVKDPSTLKAAMEGISGYQPTFGQPDFTLSFTANKHSATDGLCGLVVGQFDKDNKPGAPWPDYQPKC
jgi:branched-chain amino acid transport system substrate-binding protein